MGVIAEHLVGLRIGAIVLWFWYALRLAMGSWQITEQSEPVRREGWKFFRPSELLMAAIIIFLFSPADILIANGYIDQTTRQAMSAAGVAGLHVCAILKLVGLDVATLEPRKGWPVYVAITSWSALYPVLH